MKELEGEIVEENSEKDSEGDSKRRNSKKRR
jgi:hypothetical protein